MSLLIYIIAGEPSGDVLGGRLMAALKDLTGGAVRFAGIGGRAMRAEGLESLFPMGDLSVMGLAEVVPRIPHILNRLGETVADIGRKRPDAVVTIDSLGFTGRVQRRVKRRFPGIPRIHYVAPMVWAWKPDRARTLADSVDLLLTLLPFEPDWFVREGLATVHVGHPVAESGLDRGDGAAFRARLGIAAEAPLLLVLPGSRHSETSRLLPVFKQTMAELAGRIPNLVVVVPTVETVAAEVAAAVKSWPVPTFVVEDAAVKADVFAAATAALAASGTVSVELAMAGVPMVVGYKVSPLSAFVATRFLGLRLKYASLINIVADAPVIPELLQGRCRPDRLAEAVERLLTDADARRGQVDAARTALASLIGEGEAPSLRAARAVLSALERDDIGLTRERVNPMSESHSNLLK